MNLNISGHHLDLTPPLRDYVTTKIKRIERHFDHLINAEVVLSVEKLRHKAEATVHASGADLHRGGDRRRHMYAAIDVLMDRLDQQTPAVTQEKLRDHHVKQSAKRMPLQEPEID